MPTLNLIDSGTAGAVRRALRKERSREDLDAAAVGVFQPIEFAEATGRARCRECGRKIPRGERCAAFMLDLYVKRFGKWGNAVRAYVHYPSCPTDQEGVTP